MQLTATFANILSRLTGGNASKAASSLALAYDRARPASPLPTSAMQTRLELAQRRALKKRNNTSRKVLSNYEEKHSILARGQG